MLQSGGGEYRLKERKEIGYFSYFCSKHRLWGEVILSSSHNLCFGAKIRKIGIPLHAPVLLYKSGVQEVFITRTCFPDDWKRA